MEQGLQFCCYNILKAALIYYFAVPYGIDSQVFASWGPVSDFVKKMQPHRSKSTASSSARN
jgi:hypothetical protein